MDTGIIVEVTTPQYGLSGESSDLPYANVNWLEARDYCIQFASRLPTEREWEYAARGPSNLIYPWGNTFVEDAVIYRESSQGRRNEVGNKPKGQSWIGAMDLAGNVLEWTSTAYRDYPYDYADGREDAVTNEDRIIRGGSLWSVIEELYSVNRQGKSPATALATLGFRCARDFQPGDLP